MKRVRRHSHRQAMIDACRLMGYTIEPAADKWGPYSKNHFQYVLVNPVGNVIRQPRKYLSEIPADFVLTFCFMWQAALHALEIEGVNPDALKPPREDRTRGRAAPAVPQPRD